MKIVDIIFILLFIISMVVGIWYLFGDSPTFEQSLLILTISIVFGIAIALSKTEMKLGYLEKGFDRLEKNVRISFGKMKDDMEDIKSDMNLIKNKMKIK